MFLMLLLVVGMFVVSALSGMAAWPPADPNYTAAGQSAVESLAGVVVDVLPIAAVLFAIVVSPRIMKAIIKQFSH